MRSEDTNAITPITISYETFFRQVNVFTKEVIRNVISRKNFELIHRRVEITEFFLPRFCCKNSVKVIVLLKSEECYSKLIWRKIFFCLEVNFSFFSYCVLCHRVEITQKFRQSDDFTKKVIKKELIWRNFSAMRENFTYFTIFLPPRSQCDNFKNVPPRLFSKNSVKVFFSLKSFTMNWFHGNFLKWG